MSDQIDDARRQLAEAQKRGPRNMKFGDLQDELGAGQQLNAARAECEYYERIAMTRGREIDSLNSKLLAEAERNATEAQLSLFAEIHRLEAQLAAALAREAALVKERAEDDAVSERCLARCRELLGRRDVHGFMDGIESLAMQRDEALEAGRTVVEATDEIIEKANAVCKDNERLRGALEDMANNWMHYTRSDFPLAAQQALAAPAPATVAEWRRERELRDAAVELADRHCKVWDAPHIASDRCAVAAEKYRALRDQRAPGPGSEGCR